MTQQRADAVMAELRKVESHRRNAVKAYWRAVGETKMQLSEDEAHYLLNVERNLDRLTRSIDAAIIEITAKIDTVDNGVDR